MMRKRLRTGTCSGISRPRTGGTACSCGIGRQSDARETVCLRRRVVPSTAKLAGSERGRGAGLKRGRGLGIPTVRRASRVALDHDARRWMA